MPTHVALLAGRFAPLLSFGNFVDWFERPGEVGPSQFRHIVNAVLNSIAAGRRLAVHIVVWQLGVSLLAAALFLLTRGSQSGLAAFSGGAVVALGTTLFAWRVFVRRHADAGTTMGRLAMGTAMKWVVVIGGFYVLTARLRLPPLATLVGMIAALAIHLVSLRFKD